MFSPLHSVTDEVQSHLTIMENIVINVISTGTEENTCLIKMQR